MGYFSHPLDDEDSDRKRAWNEVVVQIKDWPPAFRAKIVHVDHHLEAKALYVLTMSRRLVRSVYRIGGDKADDWMGVYVETYALLFPMLELVGKATHPNPGITPDLRLATGLYWLNDPTVLPSNITGDPKLDLSPLKNLPHIDANISRPTVRDLVLIRHYLLHGASGHTGEPWAMNYQHPRSLAIQAEIAMREYWKQLRQDDSSNGWIARLAQADIKPFPIPGSALPGQPSFEKCLIDPDIVEYLVENKKSYFDVNRS